MAISTGRHWQLTICIAGKCSNFSTSSSSWAFINVTSAASPAQSQRWTLRNDGIHVPIACLGDDGIFQKTDMMNITLHLPEKSAEFSAEMAMRRRRRERYNMMKLSNLLAAIGSTSSPIVSRSW